MKPSSLAFTSNREQRFWDWTLVVVAAIYSTLGLARTLAPVLGESGLGPSLFVFSCLLILAAVVTQGLKMPPGGAEGGVALGITAVYLHRLRADIDPDGELASDRIRCGRPLRARSSRGAGQPGAPPALLAVLLTVPVALIDECIQLFLPSRVFDPIDMVFNVLATVMAVAAASALGWARTRGVVR